MQNGSRSGITGPFADPHTSTDAVSVAFSNASTVAVSKPRGLQSGNWELVRRREFVLRHNNDGGRQWSAFREPRR